jgi:hypothetical protein
MAVLYITEYSGLMPSPPGGQGQIPIEPPVAEQTVAIAAGSAQSAAFNAKTRLVRIHTDAICSIEFGTNPTATSTTQRLAANQTEFKGVPISLSSGVSFKVAVITNT